MVVHAQKASAQNQAHIPSSIGHEAVEIIDDVLLLLNMVPVVYDEYQFRLCGVDFARHVIVCQVNLVLLARRQAAGHVVYSSVACLLQLLGYIGKLVNLGSNSIDFASHKKILDKV